MSLSFSDAAKAKQLRDYFNRYGRIYIVVDATGDEVQLPDHLKGDPALRLVLSMRMPQQIHIRDDRVESDFSFSGRIYACRIPMHTIWGAYQPEGELEQGIIWDDSVPELIKTIVQGERGNLSAEELADQVADEQQPEPVAVSPMRVIVGGADAAAGEKDAGADTTPESPRKVSHLRVVK